MDSLTDFFDAWADAWEAALRSPRAFATIAVALFVGGYLVGAWYYSGRIEDMEQRLALRDDQLQLRGEQQSTDPARPARSRNVLLGWAPGQKPGGCEATLDLGALADYADKYDVAVVCGFLRENTDRLADRGIAISKKFSLGVPEQTLVIVEDSPATLSVLEELAKTFPAGGSAAAAMSVRVWLEPVLLPKHIAASDIHQLSDVQRLGGVILANETRVVGSTLIGRQIK
jgi:hypothetical protein